MADSRSPESLLREHVAAFNSGDLRRTMAGIAGNVTWATSGEDTSLFEDPASDPVSYDSSVFEDLFEPTLEPVLEPDVNTLTGAIGGLF